jgi:hypothetical protein
MLLLLVRKMRTRKVGLAALRTLSQRELPHSTHTGTLQLHLLLQHVRAVPLTTIEDVSPIQS